MISLSPFVTKVSPRCAAASRLGLSENVVSDILSVTGLNMNKTATQTAVPKKGAAKQADTPAKPLTPGDFVHNAEQALRTMGANIRHARKEIYKLKQYELAEKVGIDLRMLRKIESGESVPSIQLMLVLAAMRRHLPIVTAANPRVSELLVPADNMPPPFAVRPVSTEGGAGAIAQARASLRNTAHPRTPEPEHAPGPATAASSPPRNPGSPFGHIAPVNRPR